jgi:ceroid-lipofuscinosis MFS transporter 7
MTTTSSGTPPYLLSQQQDAPDPETAATNYVSMDIVTDQQEGSNDDNDDASLAPSIADSVLTADGIHDPTGFACVCLVILIGDMYRGVMFPSMWPLVEHLGGTTVLLGYSVAAFSFGRLLVNPLFGRLSHTHGYSKTLLISTSILLLGTVAYSQVYRVGSPRFLIFAQILLGIGSGTLGVTRAFVAEITAHRSRTTYMALITAVQYGGFTVTPIVGAFFNWFFSNQEEDENGHLPILNMFTAPAYFMSVVATVTLVVLLTKFKDRKRISTIKDDTQKKSRRRQEIDLVANATTFVGLTVYDCCILGFMLLGAATKGCISTFETMGIAIAQSHFSMEAGMAGFIVGCCGIIGVVALLSMGRLAERFTDLELICGGMLVMATGSALLTTLQENENVVLENPSWKYVVSFFLIYGVGYPIGHTAVLGIFSKST